MRKLIGLVLVISGLGMGCGEDAKTDSDTDPVTGDDDAGGNGGNGGNGGGIDIPDAGSAGGDEDLPYPECPREDIPEMFPPYAGPKTMTQADYMACSTKCGQDQACFDTCPGSKEFGDCLNNDVVACSAKAKGMCRTEYVDFVCCADSNKCAPDDSTCAMTKCGSEIAKIQPCISGDTMCLQAAGAACFAPPVPAMSPSLGAAASATIPAEQLSRMLLNMSVLR